MAKVAAPSLQPRGPNRDPKCPLHVDLICCSNVSNAQIAVILCGRATCLTWRSLGIGSTTYPSPKRACLAEPPAEPRTAIGLPSPSRSRLRGCAGHTGALVWGGVMARCLKAPFPARQIALTRPRPAFTLIGRRSPAVLAQANLALAAHKRLFRFLTLLGSRSPRSRERRVKDGACRPPLISHKRLIYWSGLWFPTLHPNLGKVVLYPPATPASVAATPPAALMTQ